MIYYQYKMKEENDIQKHIQNDIAEIIAKHKKINKMSAQAVGGTVGWNPICIIIPCHRLVGTNGPLNGYGGGINNKVLLYGIRNYDEQACKRIEFVKCMRNAGVEIEILIE